MDGFSQDDRAVLVLSDPPYNLRRALGCSGADHVGWLQKTWRRWSFFANG